MAWFDVTLDDPFWASRQKLVRERTLPALEKQLRQSGRMDALRLQWQPGMEPVPHHFWDSDVAKWLEAASYSLALQPDAALEASIEHAVELLASAQQPDGYLNSYYLSVEPDACFTDLRDGHELYCAGHLIEAGVAHFLATGRRSLLDVVCRYADNIGRTFGTGAGQKRGYCGHPEIELALVRLYRATGERRYLELSRYFVDERGQEPYYFDLEGALRTRPRASDDYYSAHGLSGMELRRYNQSHAPVREQDRVVGHAVRAMYLYAAMADLAREYGDDSLRAACERLWQHLASTRLYVTGGIGSAERNEGFSADFDLPNESAYAESCAAVGLVQWARRMFELSEDGAYTDVMERALYNGVASALGADGEHFFYANPLASRGHAHRQPWFEVACCPPNVARLVGSVGQYVYSVGADRIAVNLYAAGVAKLCVSNKEVRLRQRSDYPWDGQVRIEVDLDAPAAFGVWLRQPGWCREVRLSVNNEAIDPSTVRRDGYLRLQRTWQAGDCIELELSMPVERVYSHPAVAENAGSVALQRGPIVYCLEQMDNRVPLHSLQLPPDAEIRAERSDGVVTLHASAQRTDSADWHAELYRSSRPERVPHQVVAVPYATWDNRSAGEMRVWIREAAR